MLLGNLTVRDAIKTRGENRPPEAALVLADGLAGRARFPLAHLSRKSLGACFAMLGLCTAPQIASAVIPVGRCGDMVGKGGYTLRQAIALAPDGDTVDLSALPVTCSTITLTGGEIPVVQSNLTITGPSNRTVSVSANYASRVFNHRYAGTLRIAYLSLGEGHVYNSPGGCIYSKGNVRLDSAAVSHCYTANRSGGGIYAKGNVQMYGSQVSYSLVAGAGSGGGLAGQAVTITYSTLAHNSASLDGGGLSAYRATLAHAIVRSNVAGRDCGGARSHYFSVTSSSIDYNMTVGKGGGLCAPGDNTDGQSTLTISSSTIAHNQAGTGGGLDARWSHVTISNSTISTNSGGGIAVAEGSYGQPTDVAIHNSTIAFNTSPSGFGSGLTGSGGLTSCVLDVISTIIAANTGGENADFVNWGCQVTYSSQFNLVQKTTFMGQNWIAADPHLGPLADNGGFTSTHALPPGSPAVDHGANVDSLTTDQRGGGYVRVVGPDADMGAYELPDRIFAGTFD
jgi:hypothetical protein